VNWYTENEKEYGKGKLKYQEQKNAAWIGGAMDIREEEGDIVVSSSTYTSFEYHIFWKLYVIKSSAI
jgi:hypothetical protein